MRKILALSIVLLFLAADAEPAQLKKSRVYLGTIVEITITDQDKSRQQINKAIAKAFSEIKRIEDLVSRFKSGSDIGRINSFGHENPVKVTPETIKLIEQSVEFSRLTDGAFDITVYPLIEVWGIEDNGKQQIPPTSQLNQAKDLVGYQNIKVIKEEQSVFLTKPGMSLDLGGIAKGYAVDKAIETLRGAGIKNALVNAGGDIYALGGKNTNEKWQVALQHPRRKDSSLTVLRLEDQACATSGDYQRYIEIKGERFSHIINPQSGYPCQDVPASVTVLAKDCLTADALATSVFVLGPEKGIELINRLEDTEAIVVSVKDDTLDVSLSQGLKGRLELNR